MDSLLEVEYFQKYAQIIPQIREDRTRHLYNHEDEKRAMMIENLIAQELNTVTILDEGKENYPKKYIENIICTLEGIAASDHCYVVDSPSFLLFFNENGTVISRPFNCATVVMKVDDFSLYKRKILLEKDKGRLFPYSLSDIISDTEHKYLFYMIKPLVGYDDMVFYRYIRLSKSESERAIL